MPFFIKVMDRALKIIDGLKLQNMVCVFDQAIYSKAVEIKWKEPHKFKNVFIMLGMFHMLMMFMGILSKRFAAAGVRDILVQSNTISEGSVDQALCGKQYNRGVRCYKLLYESVMRRVLEEIKMEAGDIIYIDEFENIQSNEDFIKKYTEFLDFREALENGSPLQRFWMSFLEMSEILLNTIYSLRSGHFELLVECIRLIIPFAFAYDHVNYARYLTAMLADLLKLPDEFPNIYEEFMNGNFVAQLTDGTKFSGVETDKVIEMTLNKDTKTPGNTNNNIIFISSKIYISCRPLFALPYNLNCIS